MKKTIVAIALVLSSLVSQAQKIKVQTNLGIVSTFSNKNTGEWMPSNFIGLEIADKVGIEYGYAYALNTDEKQLYNYLVGNSKSWTAGNFSHLVAAYYKTDRDEGSCLNVGLGLQINKEYNTEKIRTNATPYIKVGIDHEFKSGWGAQVNTGFGDVLMFSLGITKTL